MKIGHIIAVAGALSLGGCAQLAANLVNDYQDTRLALKAYVDDVHETRREVRRICWEMLTRQVEALRAEERYDEARELLQANYPPLVTVDLVESALDREAPLSEPYGCELRTDRAPSE